MELLVGSAKRSATFEVVQKSAEDNVCERSKEYSKHYTVLHFILELLILKAKHSWSHGSFNDLLHILALGIWVAKTKIFYCINQDYCSYRSRDYH